ncbi:hypothetical protein NDU88_002921 [Pleurodeles waltl]|uniref:Uncharacterized protein n=1 Tax=Pleurodeles waltl TaxID=8319 RepID=A0AAV7LDV0_PLEWA|nr:hypothetical protein NDU88_002921 [Pleurodeles waltl]
MTAAEGRTFMGPISDHSDSSQDATIERILHEITVVGRRIEGLGTTISALAAENKSIRQHIAGFQNRVTGLEHCVTLVEDHLNVLPDCGLELLSLHSKVIDLEDKSCRNNALFFGFTEQLEEAGVAMFSARFSPRSPGSYSNHPWSSSERTAWVQNTQTGQTDPDPTLSAVYCMIRYVRSLLRPVPRLHITTKAIRCALQQTSPKRLTTVVKRSYPYVPSLVSST